MAAFITNLEKQKKCLKINICKQLVQALSKLVLGGNMISLKDYASKVHVSYEAVRQQVKRYAADLEGHITLQGKTQYLDDDAVLFLDEKRKKNPVIIYERSKDDEIEALRAERDALLRRLDEKQERIIQLQDERAVYLEQKAKYENLLELKQNADEQIRELQQSKQKQQETNDQLERDLMAERNKSWWAKLWGK